MRNQWQRQQALKMDAALKALKELNNETDPETGERVKLRTKPKAPKCSCGCTPKWDEGKQEWVCKVLNCEEVAAE